MDKQQTALCKILGTDVRRLPDQITTLLQKGVVIKLHIGRWRARATLDMEDLGLSTKEQDELIEMGTKRLLPKRFTTKLSSIETSSRSYLKSRAFKTVLGCFVSVDQYHDIRQRLDDKRAEYMDVLSEIIDNYQSIRIKLTEDYTRLGRDAYRRKKGLASSEELEILSTESTFVERFVNRIISRLPTADEIATSFRFDIELSYIPLPSLLANNELSELINNEANFISQEQELMFSLAIQLRQRVYDALEKVLESIAKNNKLHPNSAKGLSTLCEQVGALNWMGDSEIDSMISKIRESIVAKVDENALGTLEDTLKAIATITRSAIIDMGVKQRGSRIIGVSDVPTVSELRQARQVVGFELDDDFGVEMRQQRAT